LALSGTKHSSGALYSVKGDIFNGGIRNTFGITLVAGFVYRPMPGATDMKIFLTF
jgi:hypothetical protein